MRKVRLMTGLSCLMVFVMCFAIFGTSCAMSYAGVVNGMLGIQTSQVVKTEGGGDEDTTYFKSAYGEISADSLKQLKEDTYAEAVLEQEEGPAAGQKGAAVPIRPRRGAAALP